MNKFLLGVSLFASLNAVDVTFDSGTSLLWQDNPTVKAETFTYSEAKLHCKNLVLGEYSDFRIPTIHELQTIIDYRNYNPAMLKGFKHVEGDDFWSSTPYAYREGDIWTIDFKKGTRKASSQRYSKNLRCVQRIQ